MGILGLIAEFENIRRERQMDGIKKAHERGVRFVKSDLWFSEMVRRVRKLRKAGQTRAGDHAADETQQGECLPCAWKLNWAYTCGRHLKGLRRRCG